MRIPTRALVLIAAVTLALLLATTAAAAPKPAWSVQSVPAPTNFTPGEEPRIWVADTGNDRIQDWPFPVGVPSFAGAIGSAGVGSGQFERPSSVADDPFGNVWVLDTENDRVQEFNEAGEFIRQFGSAGTAEGQFSSPEGIATDAGGNVWVADTGNNRIEVFSGEGGFQRQFGSAGTSNGKFSSPKGIAVDGAGNVWVADTGNNRIQEFTPNGEFVRREGGAGIGDGRFSSPEGIATDGSGNVWVADTGNNRVQEFNPTGVFQAKFGSAGAGDGQLNHPAGIATDGSGNVWVADTGNNRVQEFNPTGVFKAKFGAAGSGDGQFSAPRALAISSRPGANRYEVFLANIGGAPSDGTAEPVTLVDTLPPGLEVRHVVFERQNFGSFDNPSFCHTQTSLGQSTVTCEISGSLGTLFPDELVRLEVDVRVPTTASGQLGNQVVVEGGGALPASTTSQNQVSAVPAPGGFEEFAAGIAGADGNPFTAAAGHPLAYATRFALNTKLPTSRFPVPLPGAPYPLVPAGGDLKRITVALPPGLTGGSALTRERCTAQQFNTLHGALDPKGNGVPLSGCPDSTAIGVIAVRQLEGFGQAPLNPIYNLVPPKGMPAQFGFQILGLPVYIDTELRSEGDYGITAFVNNVGEAKRITAAAVTIWGLPGEASHDQTRGSCLAIGGACGFSPGPAAIKPFMRLPSTCAPSNPLLTSMIFSTWIEPNAIGADSSEPAPTGCDAVPFSPSIEATPTNTVADSPTGLNVDVHIPQLESEPLEGRSQADLRDITVTLPPRLLVNPSSANGLAGCTESQVGFKGSEGGRNLFTAAPVACPDASKVAKVEVDTPLVDHPLPGSVYLAEPFQNPFNSLLAIYIVVEDPQTGVVVKLPGHVQPDPATGQLTTTVENSPQTPFEDFKLGFFDGSRASLRTPAVCGSNTTTASMTPYSAPESGPAATPSSAFPTSSSPTGGTCPTSPTAEPNSPSFEAGTTNPLAGAFSPFLLRLTRQDGSQEIKGLTVQLPPGLIGKLAGVAECSNASLSSAAQKTGRQELASASCPPGSQLGTVTVGAGAGPDPYYVQGRAYLAGPYKGAPLSMAIITPAVAGPFDLGNVVVRAALQLNLETAQITAVSDPLPTILQGIPLDVRSIALRLDRDQFTLNPTNCEAMSVSGEATSVFGQVAHLRNRFQVGSCNKLKFKPELQLKLNGATRRSGHPALKAVLTYPTKGSYANIARAQVGLPHSEFLDQGNLDKVCTQPQLKSATCPPGSVYGHAKAWTPLLDKPLEGPVYIGVGYGHQLPDLVADLNGQVRILLHGKVDTTKHEGIRNTFEVVPDAPVSKFILELKGGKKYGLLENSENICLKKQQASANFVAQNGLSTHLTPVIANSCKQKKAKTQRNQRSQKGRSGPHSSKH
jgi:NHL repeat